MSVHLSHEKVRARDYADLTAEELAAAGPETRLDVIHKDISVQGDLTQEQVERLREIAERCPVNRTLMTPPRVVASMTLGH